THGGKRPGAGAKPGNTNALKHGAYSPRAEIAKLIFAAYPELLAVLRAQALHTQPQALSRQRAVQHAYNLILDDEDLAQTIKETIKNGLREIIRETQTNAS